MGKVSLVILNFMQRLCFLFDRVSYVEDQAIKNLAEKFTANKSRLMHEFQLFDVQNTGILKQLMCAYSRMRTSINFPRK